MNWISFQTIELHFDNRQRNVTNVIRKAIIVGLTCVFGFSLGFGRDALEVESRYTGDGWFEYHFRTLEDPFIKGFTFYGLAPYPFTNVVDTILPAHWTNSFYQGKWNGIKFDGSVPQPRINEISFSVRSSSVHFKQGTNNFVTILNVQFADEYFYGGSIGGYANLSCLVPCDPAEADGSPAVLISRRELLPDMKIDELIQTNHHVYGVTFSWEEQSTVQLEGSHNLNTWTPIARLFGNPPQTTWTTNTALDTYGKFFRLSLVANRHLTNAMTSQSVASSAQRFRDVPIASQEFVQNQIRIGFDSVPDAIYEVDQFEWPGQVIATRQVVAREAFTTVSFDIRAPQRFGSFKVRRQIK